MSPIRVYANGPHGIRREHLVGCRQCVWCRRLAQNRLAGRIMSETYLRGGTFITGTFSEDYLSDEFEDKQWWISEKRYLLERLKRSVGAQKILPYAFTAERGDKTFRPHFHMTLHGVNLPKRRFQDFSWWKYGHVDTGPIEAGGASYIASYMKSKDKHELLIHARRSDKLGMEYFENECRSRVSAAKLGNPNVLLDDGLYPVPVQTHKWLPNEFRARSYPMDSAQLEMARSYGLADQANMAIDELWNELHRRGYDRDLKPHGSVYQLEMRHERRAHEYENRRIASDAQLNKPMVQMPSGGVYYLKDRS